MLTSETCQVAKAFVCEFNTLGERENENDSSQSSGF